MAGRNQSQRVNRSPNDGPVENGELVMPPGVVKKIPNKVMRNDFLRVMHWLETNGQNTIGTKKSDGVNSVTQVFREASYPRAAGILLSLAHAKLFRRVELGLYTPTAAGKKLFRAIKESGAKVDPNLVHKQYGPHQFPRQWQ